MDIRHPPIRQVGYLFSIFLLLAIPGCGNQGQSGAELKGFETLATTMFDENDIVYMVLTDRLSDGNPANNNQGNNEYRPGNLKFYQGGDWQGIINKMPYIKNLGVTAIWISPVSDDQDISKDGGEGGYHGYFTRDYYAPNPHFGNVAKLQELINTAHANGIAVIIDVVPNHTADFLAPFATSYNPSSFAPVAPFNNPSWYHHNGDITNYDDPNQVEDHDLGGLDDLDQDNLAAKTEIINVYKYWFQTTGADAARVDVAKGLKKSFLQEFEQQLGVPTFGEIFDGSVDKIADYQNYEWGVLDFPLFFTTRDVFANDLSMKKLGDLFAQDYKYVNPNRLVTFIDNHDRDRFLTVADDDWRKLRLAISFMFAARGIPDVYYGTEQAYYGDGRPKEYAGIANEQNREMLTSFNQNHDIYKHIQRLAQIRKSNVALRQGKQREMWSGDQLYAFSRRVDSTGSEVIGVFTNAWNPITTTIPLRTESSIPVGTVLKNLLNTSETVTVQPGGITGKQITVTTNAKTAQLFVSGSPATYTPPSRNVTTIRVHHNAGLGNSIFVRGDEYPLWWNQGRGAHNEGSNLWTWKTERIPAGEAFEFKALINDSQWSNGNNYVGTGGQTIDIYPNF